MATNGVDDDGNGFIDDVHGWNFAAKSSNSSDDQGHGSHCAGTIGGSGNNSIGVAGVNWQVTMMPVKFLDAQGGGTLQGAVEAINYARTMGAKIMSNSWGGGGASQALKEAIEKARDAGILFVAAAGNDGTDNDSRPVYPAAYPVENVLAVSAVDNQGGLADFSNFGKKTVHVAAPGVNVMSSTKGSSYRSLSGTSMACPHVSGVGALLLSINPSMSYSELKERIMKTSQPLASVRRKVVSRGMVSAYNAINNIREANPDKRVQCVLNEKLVYDETFDSTQQRIVRASLNAYDVFGGDLRVRAVSLGANTNVPNSRLPISSEVAKFPATRQTNRSPNPRSKTISAGTRESAQPKIAAKGA
ncbi:hypothetical protein EBZ37_13485 [bacterium]|nr:hypothetical protein [bacterium]